MPQGASLGEHSPPHADVRVLWATSDSRAGEVIRVLPESPLRDLPSQHGADHSGVEVPTHRDKVVRNEERDKAQDPLEAGQSRHCRVLFVDAITLSKGV